LLFLQLGPAAPAALLISAFRDMQISPRGGSKRERSRECVRACVYGYECVCVCCEKEERKKERERERTTERESENVCCVTVCVVFFQGVAKELFISFHSYNSNGDIA
jgi:hypothetical protein